MAELAQRERSAMHGRAAALLVTGGVLLACANVYIIVTPVDISPTGVMADDPSTAAELTLAEAPDRGDVSQTTARPLFSETRRPEEKVAEPVAAASSKQTADAPEKLELRGLMKRGGRMQALIRSGENLAGSWVPLGGSRDGLHVREIKGDVAVVELKGQRYELPMQYRGVRVGDTSAEPRTP
jgi:hypothetical protein